MAEAETYLSRVSQSVTQLFLLAWTVITGLSSSVAGRLRWEVGLTIGGSWEVGPNNWWQVGRAIFRWVVGGININCINNFTNYINSITTPPAAAVVSDYGFPKS